MMRIARTKVSELRQTKLSLSRPTRSPPTKYNFMNRNFHTTSFLRSNDHSFDKDYSFVSTAEFPTEHFKHYQSKDAEASKRAFSYFVVGTAGFGYSVALKNGVIGLLSTISPSADVLALANVEVDLSGIPEGSSMTVKWRGKPLFIRHRTAQEVDAAVSVPLGELKDPQADDARVKKAEWLILLGICTHLGCVPLNNSGDYNGWFCPCHGSHYDTSGRIRKGPAPLNLEIPPYTFIEDAKVLVGVDQL